ncbi:hypothetical protein BH09ACT7_BH09ACT7_28510 [soil metagenome]
MIAMRSHRVWLVVAIAIASLALGLASTATLAGAGPFARKGPFPAAPTSCAAPALSGSVVDVTLTDMGGMMGSGMMGPGMMGPGMMGNGSYGPGATNNGYSWPGMGMMRVLVNPSTVPAGPVSLRVHNTGALTHEVIVLPLGAGQYPGQRAIGLDGKVDESGSLGEASRACGADQGDGVVPGATAWTTITLPPGRYELVCNIAGHYGAGTFAELDVTGQPK